MELSGILSVFRRGRRFKMSSAGVIPEQEAPPRPGRVAVLHGAQQEGPEGGMFGPMGQILSVVLFGIMGQMFQGGVNGMDLNLGQGKDQNGRVVDFSLANTLASLLGVDNGFAGVKPTTVAMVPNTPSAPRAEHPGLSAPPPPGMGSK
jgi:hypothetical protein